MLERREGRVYFKGEPFIWGTDHIGREPVCIGTPDKKVFVAVDEENIYYFREGELVWSRMLELKYWPLQRMSISEDGQFVAVYSAFRNEVNLDVFKATGENVRDFNLRDWGDRVEKTHLGDFWECGPIQVFDRPGGGFNTKKIVEFLAEKEREELNKE